MARTDALFAHKFLTSKVQNVGGEGEEGGKSRRARGKVANFTKARALHPSMGVCVSTRGINDDTFYNPSHCECQSYFTQYALQNTYKLFYNVSRRKQQFRNKYNVLHN